MPTIARFGSTLRRSLAASALLVSPAVTPAQSAPPTQAKTPPTKTQSPPSATKAPAPATVTKTQPPPPGTKAQTPAGTKAQTPAPTKTQTPAPAKTPTPAAARTPTPPAGQAGGAPRAGTGINVVASDTASARPLVIMREVFDYEPAGRRDPFQSLLTTTDLRPTLSDLKLLMTIVDEPGRSVALLQDNHARRQQSVRVGSRLGRMRVAGIRENAVIFTIEEFGMNRRDSLLLRDTTKARGR